MTVPNLLRCWLSVVLLSLAVVSPVFAGLRLHGTSQSTPATIPLQANLVTRFSADAITPQSDNTSLSSWTDSVNGIVAGTQVGTLPLYRTNRVNGKPSVSFNSTGSFGGISIASPGALKTAIDSQVYTVFIAFKNTAPENIGALIAASAGGSSFLYYADGTNVQRYNNGTGLRIPYAGQTSWSTFGTISGSLQSISLGSEFQFVNGGCVTSIAVNGAGTGGNAITLGTNAGNNFPGANEIFEILVWNVALTPAQYMQAEMWARDKYAQAYPWSPLVKMPVVGGDSISAGIGASTVANQPAYLMAQSLGLTFGQWHNLAVPGITLNQMITVAPNLYDGIPSMIGKKTGLIAWEWANQQTSTTTAGATFLAARKAIANQQTVWGTSTSATLYDNSATRATYDSAWDAAHTTNIDAYMAIHTDTHIGVDGSYATFSTPTGGDGLHLTDTTYPFLAAFFVSGFQALP